VLVAFQLFLLPLDPSTPLIYLVYSSAYVHVIILMLLLLLLVLLLLLLLLILLLLSAYDD